MNLRLALPLALIAALTACTSAPVRNPLAQWVPSPNHNARSPVIIVLHHTEQDSVQESLDTLRSANSGGKVSSHYLVGRDGDLYQLVADSERAWHAGGGRWGSITDLNSASLGIEIDNNGDSPFTQPQIATLLRLLGDLCTRYNIPRNQIIGHADLAPTRKADPSRFFPWQQLAEAGFGIWPNPAHGPAPEGFDRWMALQALGYSLEDRAAAARAFHRRFRGSDTLPSELDVEDARILHSLLLQKQ
ncbi:N-acetylmuramoyl-L-alanine amidase [Stenotrophomonas sp. Iso1]|uniref:N-acetylmuramoyl-L-alanine amidase n=1 Tax=Stenotrophomonas sp. Iso1 TaxID=2977283 RepID=UPI0022B7A4F2|nr:N-acetylmuramoyl-L-alanine amidase [Stenotrophomonas sp. Iso1]